MACALPLGADAQELSPGPEIGVRGGITRFFAGNLGDDAVTVVQLPASSIYPFGTSAYFTYFTSSRFAVEPQAGIAHYSGGNDGTTYITLAVQLMQFARPDAAGTASGYGFIHGGMVGAAGNHASSTMFQLGGGGGYRFVYRKSLGVRIEARYRRWVDDNLMGANEVSLGVGFGAVLGRKEE